MHRAGPSANTCMYSSRAIHRGGVVLEHAGFRGACSYEETVPRELESEGTLEVFRGRLLSPSPVGTRSRSPQWHWTELGEWSLHAHTYITECLAQAIPREGKFLIISASSMTESSVGRAGAGGSALPALAVGAGIASRDGFMGHEGRDGIGGQAGNDGMLVFSSLPQGSAQGLDPVELPHQRPQQCQHLWIEQHRRGHEWFAQHQRHQRPLAPLCSEPCQAPLEQRRRS